MKRTTHILLGAAVALPIAASLSPIAAAGAVWLGMVGGGYPDWVDLRSDFKTRLKHRGISHSLIVGIGLTVGLYLVLQIVSVQFSEIMLDDATMRALSLAFGVGFLSHLLADACTHAGVRLFVPFNTDAWWILPKPLRGKSNGGIDTIGRFLAILVIVLTAWDWVQPLLP